MAHGKNGKLVIGVSGVVAGVTNWTRSQKSDLVESGAMGDGDDKSYEVGRRETTYAIQGNYNAADADGQELLVGGAAVDFKLYPEGDGTSKKYYAGSGIVESVDQTGPLDGKITFSCTIRQTGAGTRPTVS